MVGVPDALLDYNVWYQDLARDATGRQQRWREFLMADDPKEETVRQGDWIGGEDRFRPRMHIPAGACHGPLAWPAAQAAAGRGGVFPQFYER